MKKEKIVIDLGGDKLITLIYEPFDSDVDISMLTRIDYENIVGEIVTIPALMNRVANLKAEVENRLAENEVELNIYEAGLKKQFRSILVSEGKKFTIGEIDERVLMDDGWQNRKNKFIRYQKDCDYVNALYWAIKTKADLISNIKNNLTPKEFQTEILEGTVNGIMIKFHKKMGRDV